MNLIPLSAITEDAEPQYFDNVDHGVFCIKEWINNEESNDVIRTAVDQMTWWEMKAECRSEIMHLFDVVAARLGVDRIKVKTDEYGERVIQLGKNLDIVSPAKKPKISQTNNIIDISRLVGSSGSPLPGRNIDLSNL